MNTRALMASTGVVLLIAAVNTAFNGVWALGGMDAFASEWNGRLQATENAAAQAQGRAVATVPSTGELFESLNGHVGHRLSRIMLWGLAVQGFAGAALVVGAFMAPATAKRVVEDAA